MNVVATDTIRLRFKSKALRDLISGSAGILKVPAKTSEMLNSEIFSILYQGYAKAKSARIGKPLSAQINKDLDTAEKIFVMYVDKHLGTPGLLKYCDEEDIRRHISSVHQALQGTNGQYQMQIDPHTGVYNPSDLFLRGIRALRLNGGLDRVR